MMLREPVRGITETLQGYLINPPGVSASYCGKERKIVVTDGFGQRAQMSADQFAVLRRPAPAASTGPAGRGRRDQGVVRR
jgi:hypothetical protein